ncbi:CTP synthase [Staphylococcus gallinarum]|uniref:CTP synthase n=1 Tax=Staphylococcus gallinarum TaxID=1293 RepID=A0A380FJ92_STAGA|nr:CTP synthase [Staphylococcus gallinarum]
MVFSGTSPDGRLVEMVEIPENGFLCGLSVPS